MKSLILTLLCLLAVSACGQVPPITDGEKYVLRVTKAVVDTSDSDSLYRRTADFDTLYWAWGDHHSGPPRLYRDLPRPKYWERIPGRWDTTTVEVCDTVWTTTYEVGDKRCQRKAVQCRDSLVVTPKNRWE